MKYQNDAHHYRKVVRKRRVFQRVKGISLITVSLALMFYAVPCFAVSVFDYGQSEKASSTSFSSEISDYKTADGSAIATGAQAVEKSKQGSVTAAEGASEEMLAPAYAVSDYSLVSNTTGPGALSNEAAVSAARTRSEAFAAAAQGSASPSSSLISVSFAGSSAGTAAGNHATPTDLILAAIAFVAGIVCAILGIRMIARGHQMRGMQIAAAYSHALRA